MNPVNQWSAAVLINAVAADRYNGEDPTPYYADKVMEPTRDLLLQRMNPEREYTATELMDICGVGRGKIEPELVLLAAEGLTEIAPRGGGRQRKWRVTDEGGKMYQPSGFDALALSQCFKNYTYRSDKHGIRK